VNALAGGPVAWELPGGSTAALALAVLVGVVAAALAARALFRRPGSRRFAVCGASGARGLAVAAALLAASAPHLIRTRADDSARFVAAHDEQSVDGLDADTVVRWPGDAPDAAAALETLRAVVSPTEPADVLLRTGAEPLPSGAAVERALRNGARTRTAIVADGDVAEAVAPAPADGPRIIAPAGAVAGIPVTLSVEDGGRAFEGEEATLTVEGGAGSRTIVLTAGRRRVDAEPLDLAEGTHLVTLRTPGRAPSVAFVDVAAPPSVAIVTADAAAGKALNDLFRAQGLPATVLAPDRAGRDGFGDADVLVLGPGARGAALDARIAGRLQLGAGLLVLGGKGEDGLRRHAGGLVEPLLPVSLPPEPPPPPVPPDPPEPPPPDPPPDSDENPDLKLDEGPKLALRVALLLVIDTSGSMVGDRLKMAKTAAALAAQNLDPQDRVGVLAFTGRPKWIATFQDAVDLGTLNRKLQRLKPGGDTNFFPALKTGFEAIRREPCGIRHVILFTDGDSRPAVFRPLVAKAASDRITLSTIAIGSEANGDLLGRLASWGKGKLWFANDPRRLPEVVTKDTRRISVDVRDERRAELEDVEGAPSVPDPTPERDDPTAAEPEPEPDTEPEPEKETAPDPRVPRVVADAAFLAGLDDAVWPAFAHPEEPQPRGVALVVLAWDEGDKAPALTLGRSGAARIAVLAADTSTSDGRAVLEWDRGGAFLAQLVRSLAAPPALDRGGVVAAAWPALDGSVRMAAPIDGDCLLRLTFQGDGERLAISCASLKQGWTGGRAEQTPAAGVWAGLFVPASADAQPRRVALVSPGPARPARHAVADLAAASGAPLLSAPPERRGGPADERKEPLGAPLAGAAAALVLIEAVLRRMV